MAQTFTNTNFIQRRRQIGTYANLAGLAILVAGFVASLNAEQVVAIPTGAAPVRIPMILLAYIALFVGFGLSSFGSRYLLFAGLEPEKKLGLNLKGLDKQYRLYSYATPVHFVLLTPFALYVLLVKPQDGDIVVNGNHWRQPFSMLRLFRFIAVEPLGNPVRQLADAEARLKSWLEAELPNVTVPIRGYIVFMHPRARLTVENSTAPILALNTDPNALKEALRRERGPNLPQPTYAALADLLKAKTHAQAAEQ